VEQIYPHVKKIVQDVSFIEILYLKSKFSSIDKIWCLKYGKMGVFYVKIHLEANFLCMDNSKRAAPSLYGCSSNIY